MIDRGINWKSFPLSGPHFGGVWERLVASCKRSLLAVIQERFVTDDILLTVTKEVSSLLNTRQITRVSTDQSKPEPLTPNHSILGCLMIPQKFYQPGVVLKKKQRILSIVCWLVWFALTPRMITHF
jgi:hypothetical protein